MPFIIIILRPAGIGLKKILRPKTTISNGVYSFYNTKYSGNNQIFFFYIISVKILYYTLYRWRQRFLASGCKMLTVKYINGG